MGTRTKPTKYKVCPLNPLLQHILIGCVWRSLAGKSFIFHSKNSFVFTKCTLTSLKISWVLIIYYWLHNSQMFCIWNVTFFVSFRKAVVLTWAAEGSVSPLSRCVWVCGVGPVYVWSPHTQIHPLSHTHTHTLLHAHDHISVLPLSYTFTVS